MWSTILALFLIFNLKSRAQNIICLQENVTCSEQDLVKIYWDLDGLHQESPKLIEFIKNRILVPPDSLPLEMLGTVIQNFPNVYFFSKFSSGFYSDLVLCVKIFKRYFLCGLY